MDLKEALWTVHSPDRHGNMLVGEPRTAALF